jgi:hypothetical protein
VAEDAFEDVDGGSDDAPVEEDGTDEVPPDETPDDAAEDVDDEEAADDEDELEAMLLSGNELGLAVGSGVMVTTG